ncbi:MAG TPA: RHS repeat-associated core domain-containing protein [Longimicrobium sp.]|jgi:RHS repeat-associated protein
MLFRLAALLAVVALVCAGSTPAAAQQPCQSLNPRCTNYAPFVAVTPAGGTYTTPYVTVTVEFSDDSGLNFGSFQAKLNGHVIQGGLAGAGTEGSTVLGLDLAPGVNTLEVSVCDLTGKCDAGGGSYTYTQPPPAQWHADPLISLAPYSEGVRTVSPFDAVQTYTTPAYVSKDVPRSVTLVYTGAQAQARAFVQVDAFDNSQEKPATLSIQVLDAAGNPVTGERHYSVEGAATHRLAATWTAPHLPTGAYTYLVAVRSHWAGDTRTSTVPVRVLIVNEQGSRFGAGWSVAGLQRLHFRGDSVMVTNGDGSAVYFAKNGFTIWKRPEGEWSELTRPDSLWHRRWPDGTEAVFSGDGYLKYVTDRFQNTTSFSWTWTADGARVPYQIVDPVQQATTFAYHGANGTHSYKLGAIYDPGGRGTGFAYYDGQNNLTYVHEADQGVGLVLGYDGAHRLVSRANRDGGTWTYVYDAAGLVAADSLPTVTLEGGAQARPAVRFRAWETALLSPGPGAAPRVDSAAARAEVTDPRGAVTRLAFDRFFQPTRVEEPLGDTTLISRNEQGQPTTVVLPTGAVSRYQWEGASLTRSWDAESGGFTDYTYETAYNQLETVSSGGAVTTYHYGPRGELRKVRLGSDSTLFDYTPDWRILWSQDAAGHRTDYTYQPTGFRNLAEVRDLDASGSTRVVSYGYDSYGRAATVTDAAGTVQRFYDLINRDTAVSDPAGTTRLTYQETQLYRVTDAAGKAYTFHHNPLGWLTSEVDPNGRPRSFGYDVAGNVVRATDRRNRTVTFSHDSLGRVLARTADGATTTYEYGPDRRWVYAHNDVSADTIRFDERGRPTDEVTIFPGVPGGVFRRTSTWSEEGLRERLAYNAPGRTLPEIRFRYNASLQLDGILAFGAWTNLYYNDDAQVDTIWLPSGARQTFQYTGTHLPAQARWSVPGLDGRLGFRYGFDHLDRLLLRNNASGSTERRYSYDAVSRLTGFSHLVATPGDLVCENPWQPSTCYRPTEWVETDAAAYSYDAVGNRTDAGASLQPASNRYATFRGYGFAYDEEGNLTRKYNASYDQTLSWNSLGQLESVTTNGVTVFYGYNGFGQRVVRSVAGGSSTYSVYDGDDLLLEVDQNGTLLREFAHYPGIDRPHSLRAADGSVYYYATEYPGHVAGLFNSSNQVVNEYRHNPWGETEVVTEGVPQPLRYMARELDALTGLYYVRNRWYDPVLARFVSDDPIGLAGGINTYAYVGNSPTNYLDPLGLLRRDGCIDWYLITINRRTGQVVSETYVRTTCPEGGNGNEGHDEKNHRQCPLPPPLPPGASVDDNVSLALRAWWLRWVEGIGELLTMAWFRDMVGKNKPWDYQQSTGGLRPEYEDGGNFNYGATGRAVGFSRGDLLRAAGYVQSRNPSGSAAGDGHWWGRAPYGDERVDQAWIRQGIRYYEEGCYKK